MKMDVHLQVNVHVHRSTARIEELTDGRIRVAWKTSLFVVDAHITVDFRQRCGIGGIHCELKDDIREAT